MSEKLRFSVTEQDEIEAVRERSDFVYRLLLSRDGRAMSEQASIIFVSLTEVKLQPEYDNELDPEFKNLIDEALASRDTPQPSPIDRTVQKFLLLVAFCTMPEEMIDLFAPPEIAIANGAKRPRFPTNRTALCEWIAHDLRPGLDLFLRKRDEDMGFFVARMATLYGGRLDPITDIDRDAVAIEVDDAATTEVGRQSLKRTQN